MLSNDSMIYRLLFTISVIALCVCFQFYTNLTMKSINHFKCRGGVYPLTEISRLVFTDELVPWNAKYENYNPPFYNSPALRNKPWADPDIGW